MSRKLDPEARSNQTRNETKEKMEIKQVLDNRKKPERTESQERTIRNLDLEAKNEINLDENPAVNHREETGPMADHTIQSEEKTTTRIRRFPRQISKR